MPLGIVTLNQTFYGKYMANVLCFDNVQEDITWLQEFADAIRESADDRWDNLCDTQWTLDNITVSFIEGDHITYSVDVDFTAGDLQGNFPGDGASPGTAMLMATRYVGPAPNRGRIYFTGFSETVVGNGVWTNGALAEMKLLVEEWVTGYTIQGTNTSLQILRRPSDKFPTYVANPAQTVNRRDFTRSQRRRNLNQ